MLIRTSSGKSVVLDFRETAPEMASKGMFDDDPDAVIYGAKAVAIP